MSGPWNDEAEALEDSIARWKRIAAGEEALNDGSCALCSYHELRTLDDPTDTVCERCVVRRVTGVLSCDATTYYVIARKSRLDQDFSAEADEMVTFLESLRDRVGE